jgi:hypothetical protein
MLQPSQSQQNLIVDESASQHAKAGALESGRAPNSEIEMKGLHESLKAPRNEAENPVLP